MSKLDLNELQAPLKEKEKIRNDIYDKVLKRCHSRIKMVSRQPNTFCYFVIPEFVLGVPAYNFNECKHYIIESIRNNGLAVNYIDPNLLYISWDIEHLHSKQIDTKQVNQEHLPLPVDSSMSYLAPQPVLSPDQQGVALQGVALQQQPVQMSMQQQQFRSTEEYKPIGMFGSNEKRIGF
jgi:hypothetical protein